MVAPKAFTPDSPYNLSSGELQCIGKKQSFKCNIIFLSITLSFTLTTGSKAWQTVM